MNRSARRCPAPGITRWPIALVALSFLAVPAAEARAQQADAPQPARDTVVVYVSKAAADSAFRALASGPPVFRAVPLPNPSYQFLAATRREAGDAELHERWTDIAYVRSGTAVLRTGPALEHPRSVEPYEWRGPMIVGARDRTMGPGDFVVIPAGVAHQWRPSGRTPFSYVTLKVAADSATTRR